MSELVSVIIPVYNVEKYIRKCLNSVISQSYVNLEIIVVDDGSFDMSGSICDEYKFIDSRITVIHKKNGGLSSARNVGIACACGDFLFFLDSDDYIEPDAIEIMVQETLYSNSDLCICNIDYVDESGGSLEDMNVTSPMKIEQLNKEEMFNKLIQKACWYYIPAWNKLYRKEIFENICFPEGKQHEDEFIAHLVIDNCKKICTVNKRLYHYVQRSGSIMNVSVSLKRLDGLEALLSRTSFFLQKGYYTQAEGTLKIFAKMYCKLLNSSSDATMLSLGAQLKKQARIIFCEMIGVSHISSICKAELRLFFFQTKIYNVYEKVKNRMLGG